MGRVIPNEQTWVGFAASIAAASLEPTETEIDGCTDLTPFLMSLNASSQGNVVPTPSFDTLFETSIVGTSQATFTADFYRDDAADTAWDTFPRGAAGFVVISRFGGTGADQLPRAGNTVEVWPVMVVSRTAANMQNNAVQTFTITCSVNIAPNEAASVTGGGASVPSVPRNLAGTAGASGILVLDWDVPASGSPFTGYDAYSCATLNGEYVKKASAITKVGTTATITGLTPGATLYWKVSASNANGEGPQTTPGKPYASGA